MYEEWAKLIEISRESVTKYEEKAEVRNDFFAPVFKSKTSFRHVSSHMRCKTGAAGRMKPP